MEKKLCRPGNEEIYQTIWEGRPCGNDYMSVYYNALRRLKKKLQEERIDDLLISTPRGQMINTHMFDCDYYAWLDGSVDNRNRFEGEFLSEYSWGEALITDIMEARRGH